MTKQHPSVPSAKTSDQGLAMATVIIITFTISSLAIALTSLSVSALGKAANDEDWQAALNAANAGVSEYLARLNEDADYWKYRDSKADFSSTSEGNLDPENLALTNWKAIDGEEYGPKVSEFRYEVDNSQYRTEGVIRLQSSGRVGNTVRTVETILRRRSFIDYLYFTDYETVDPALNGLAKCESYYYTDRDSDCPQINFGNNDEINGPLHSNDAIQTCGSPTFNDEVSTSWRTNRERRYLKGCYWGNPTFTKGPPRFVEKLGIPPSNTEIRQQVNANYTDTPGCLYTGPTTIKLLNTGKMKVWSPGTNRQERPACGGGASEEEVDLPSNGVIFVREAGEFDEYENKDPNCPDAETNCVGYPKPGDDTEYEQGAGDVFISGELKGSLTVSADRIIVIGDLTYNDIEKDLLGLVSLNHIEVYHPYGSAGNLDDPDWGTDQVAEINAALLAVNNSIRVQSHDRGGRLGTLRIFGAMGQSFRGTVGTARNGNLRNGYLKDYNYDYRLKYQSPPHFLDPVQSAFAISVWSEEDRAY